VWINNRIFQTRIDKDQLLNYLQNGKENRYFRKEEIDLQLSLGWTFGKLI